MQPHLSFFLGIPRFFYPYEIIWGEGSMYVQVDRILNHQPLYSLPTMYYVAWLYEPIYYYASAAVASITGMSFVTDRVVSLLSTVTLVVIIYACIKRETGRRYLAFSGVGLFLAAYGRTGYSMLAARIDPLFVALLFIALATLFYSRTRTSLFLSAFIFALSFLTKQSAIIFLPMMVIYVWKKRGRRDALAFVSSVAALVTIGLGVMVLCFDRWFTYYSIFVPFAKTKTLTLYRLAHFFFFSILLHTWPICTALLAYVAFSHKRQPFWQRPNAVTFFGLFLVSSFVLGLLAGVYKGGDSNVLLPIAVGCALFVPVAVHEIANKNSSSRYLFWSIPIQLICLLSPPSVYMEHFLSDQNRVDQEAFYRYLADLKGEVWTPQYVIPEYLTGKQSYSHEIAIREALNASDEATKCLQHEFNLSFQTKRWSYIISDNTNTVYPQYKLFDTIANSTGMKLPASRCMYRYVPE